MLFSDLFATDVCSSELTVTDAFDTILKIDVAKMRALYMLQQLQPKSRLTPKIRNCFVL